MARVRAELVGTYSDGSTTGAKRPGSQRGVIKAHARDARTDDLTRAAYEYVHPYLRSRGRVEVRLPTPAGVRMIAVFSKPHSYTSPLRSLEVIHVPRVSP